MPVSDNSLGISLHVEPLNALCVFIQRRRCYLRRTSSCVTLAHVVFVWTLTSTQCFYHVVISSAVTTVLRLYVTVPSVAVSFVALSKSFLLDYCNALHLHCWPRYIYTQKNTTTNELLNYELTDAAA